MKPLLEGSEGSNSYAGLGQNMGLTVPGSQTFHQFHHFETLYNHMSLLSVYKSLWTHRFFLSRLGIPSLIMDLYYSSNMKLIFLHFVLVHTIESILQRIDRRVSVFDPMVRPPCNAFSIKRHHLLCPIGELIQLEGVFKRIKQT